MNRNSQKIVRYIAMLTFSFTIALNFAFANYAFKKKIKSVCSSYRVSVNASAMDFDSDLFSLTLESNRNNFEMVMLVGFASAGQAIAHQKEMNLSNAYIPLIISLNVAVPASRDEFNTFSASCSSEMAISLADGRMDSSEFMQKIMKNIKIQ